LARQIDNEEQSLRDILSGNVKKHRNRRARSQFALAAKINMSTNFLADLEAGNTWVSALTLIKLAKAFDVEVYELLKPDLKDSIEKALEHVKKRYTG
jgi:transcriptional regulator with XRE-family HTH domain